MSTIGIITATGTNFNSLKSALKNYQLKFLEDPTEIKHCHRLILPGVGHAERSTRLLQPWKEELTQTSTPLLGICMGMQVLCDELEEGNVTGLKRFPSRVSKLPDHKMVPHMGWSTLSASKGHPLFRDIENESYYFVHSYAAILCDETIAEVSYGSTWSAALHTKNYLGVQFHPEKSGSAGLKLLKNFVENLWN